jgi:HPt (histidine-containing phosphotransfer) domain-containing protein
MDGFDHELLDRLRVALGEEMYSELAQDFDADIPRMMKRISDAHEASDHAELEGAAHELKGVAVLFGAASLARTCTELLHLEARSTSDIADLVELSLALCTSAQATIRRSVFTTAS